MKKRKIIVILFLIVILAVSVYGANKPLPEGISTAGEFHEADVQFLYDLTYTRGDQRIYEQEIFEHIEDMIREADQFIVIDMFLFNDDYDHDQYSFPPLSRRLTEALVSKKQQNPDMHITFITDEVNTFYGVYPSPYLEALKQNGINVVLTDLNRLRDSNPFYSGLWRTALKWFGTSGNGWLPNPFSPDSPEVTLRGYLKLLNFKANHRKVVITEKEGLVTSANPHDASGYHSNIAFSVKGDLIRDLLASEQAVVRFSTGEPLSLPAFDVTDQAVDTGTKVRLLTEAKIRDYLVESLEQTSAGDEVRIGMFYLSDRQVINQLLEAAERGVRIQLVLDPNKDAFGRQKNGIPNRSVADELYSKSGGEIEIRWYDTRGEQFHTKMALIRQPKQVVIFGGSANLTRRNIGDYNLETDLQIVTSPDSPIAEEVTQYFDRIISNQDGQYTLDLEAYRDDSFWKYWLYRFQEWSGISTF
ncbi:MAG: phospholipase [Bacillaceae bacterium]|nr:phospholipase [Bacillaceae bacterium]